MLRRYSNSNASTGIEIHFHPAPSWSRPPLDRPTDGWQNAHEMCPRPGMSKDRASRTWIRQSFGQRVHSVLKFCKIRLSSLGTDTGKF